MKKILAITIIGTCLTACTFNINQAEKEGVNTQENKTIVDSLPHPDGTEYEMTEEEQKNADEAFRKMDSIKASRFDYPEEMPE